jgi:hypothetical protein
VKVAASTAWEILRNAGIDAAPLDRGCRRELLDRGLIWNQAHLRRIRGGSTKSQFSSWFSGSWRSFEDHLTVI